MVLNGCLIEGNLILLTAGSGRILQTEFDRLARASPRELWSSSIILQRPTAECSRRGLSRCAVRACAQWPPNYLCSAPFQIDLPPNPLSDRTVISPRTLPWSPISVTNHIHNPQISQQLFLLFFKPICFGFMESLGIIIGMVVEIMCWQPITAEAFTNGRKISFCCLLFWLWMCSVGRSG